MDSERSHAEVIVNAFGAYLAGHGLADWDGGTLGGGPEYTEATPWPVFVGPNMPAAASRVIVVTPTVATSRRANVAQGLQLRGRGPADSLVWDVVGQLQKIRDHFTRGGIDRSSFDMAGVYVGRVTVTSDPQILANDAERRPGATLNLRIHSRRVARL